MIKPIQVIHKPTQLPINLGEMVIDNFAGGGMSLSNEQKIRIAKRRAMVASKLDQGARVIEVSRALGISAQQVCADRKAIAKARQTKAAISMMWSTLISTPNWAMHIISYLLPLSLIVICRKTRLLLTKLEPITRKTTQDSHNKFDGRSYS